MAKSAQVDKPKAPRKAAKAKRPAKKAPARKSTKGKARKGHAAPAVHLTDDASGESHTARSHGHGAQEELLVTLATEDELEGRTEEPMQAEIQEEVVEAPLEQPFLQEWSLPEEFLLVALHEGWDDRDEKVKAGKHGASLAASLLFELVVHDRLRLHLDRYQIVGEPTGDPALDHFAKEVELVGHQKAQTALELLGRKAGRHISPWRGRLHKRGIAREEHWRFLGVIPRSRTLITDNEAKAKLENRLQRTLVGGTPDVRTILLLGLIDAAGLLPEIIPAGALAFNRKRINALLTGRDTLGYRVDPGMSKLQGALVHGLLRDVRTLTGNRD